MTPARFPHSDTPDHSSFANSPGLIAGYYVLHRLSMPRHPPCALHSLPPPQTHPTAIPLPKTPPKRHPRKRNTTAGHTHGTNTHPDTHRPNKAHKHEMAAQDNCYKDARVHY